MTIELQKLVENSGRTFEVGKELAGRPGIEVKRIHQTGNFIQVDFGIAFDVPAVPHPVVLHIGDVKQTK